MEINLNQLSVLQENDMTYSIPSNGRNYSLEILCKNEAIELKIKRKFSRNVYQKLFILDDFTKIHFIFYSLSDLTAIYKTIKEKLSSLKFEIKEEAEHLKFSLLFDLDSKKQYATINIEKNDNNNLADVVDEHSDIIESLSEKNNLLEKEKNALQERNLEIEKRLILLEAKMKDFDYEKFKFLEDKIKNLENERPVILDRVNIIQLENKELLYYGDLKKSKIVKKYDIEIVKEWIGENSSLSLLYRASSDGKKAADFHKLCDNRGPTISFIKTTEGKRIGGYTTLSWDSSGTYKANDLYAFTFTLDRKVKFPIKNQNSVIYCHSGCSVAFGDGHDIFVADNIGEIVSYTYNSSYPCSDNEYLLGSKTKVNFVVEDVEVYSVTK